MVHGPVRIPHDCVADLRHVLDPEFLQALVGHRLEAIQHHLCEHVSTLPPMTVSYPVSMYKAQSGSMLSSQLS